MSTANTSNILDTQSHACQPLTLTVMLEGRPAENIRVEVTASGKPFATVTRRAGIDGKVIFVVPGGAYEVRVYPDPMASGGPQVNHVEVS
jgi:hypothetical protein